MTGDLTRFGALAMPRLLCNDRPMGEASLQGLGIIFIGALLLIARGYQESRPDSAGGTPLLSAASTNQSDAAKGVQAG